jgi:hypothetical protein
VTIEVRTTAELKDYQQLVLVQDLQKILGVTPAARSHREQIRRLFVVAGISRRREQRDGAR